MGFAHKLVTLCIIALCIPTAPGDKLGKYVTTAMNQYSDWLLSKGLGLDPTPPSETSIDMKYATETDQLYCQISKLTVRGLSFIDNNIMTVTSDMSQNKFDVTFYGGPLQYQGVYTLIGRTKKMPVSGSGAWSKIVPVYKVTAEFENFTVKSTGFIDASNAEYTSTVLFDFGANTFDGLDGNKYERDAGEIFAAMSNSTVLLRDGYVPPLKNILAYYLMWYFEKVPLNTPDEMELPKVMLISNDHENTTYTISHNSTGTDTYNATVLPLPQLKANITAMNETLSF